MRILHLAFGVLEWRETERNEAMRSPLVLVPAELVRESAQEPFELRAVEERAVLNLRLTRSCATIPASNCPYP